MTFISFLFKKKFPGASVRASLLGGPLTVTRLLWYVLAGLVLVLLFALLVTLNNRLLVTVPASGGVLREGVIGAPRFINPILAATRTDTALTDLVYAGLMKELGDGTLVPELAKEYHLSPDGKTYTFLLREKIFFHDHTPVTSGDVAFTIEKLQDSSLNPSSAARWQRLSVSTPDERTVIVTLASPDASVLRMMTVGIMPFSLWQGIEGELLSATTLNLAPVGAGAFRVASVEYDEKGAPTSLTLKRHRAYPLAMPLLRELRLEVFASQSSLLSALRSKAIDFTFDLSSETLVDGALPREVVATPIPSTTSVELYLHRGSSALSSPALLALLNRFVDKAAIVATVENGYGIPLEDHSAAGEMQVPSTLEASSEALAALGYTVSSGVLSKGGTPVALAIATLNTPKRIETGRALSGQLASLGVIADVQAFDLGTFQSELSAETFPLVLTDSETALSDSYLTGIPLYTTATILAAHDRAKGIAQSALDSPKLRYATVEKWHTRTQRLYPSLLKLLKLEERI